MAGIVQRYTLDQFAQAAQAGTIGPLPPPGVLTLSPQAGKVLSQLLVSDVKKRFSSSTSPEGTPWRPLKYPRPNGGNAPLRDTGQLMASITGKADATGVVVGTNRVGAALHNFGGTIRPKKRKFLAIPLTREAKRAGSPRRLRKTKGIPLFARKVRGRWFGHFLLTRKAVIPARPFMGVSREGEKLIGQALADLYARGWVQMPGKPGGTTVI
jgi:phage gpG-like protein